MSERVRHPPEPTPRGLMSAAAANLYRRLTATPPIDLDELAPADPALIELESIGLLAVSADKRVTVLPAVHPLGRLLQRRQRDLATAHRALLDEFARWTDRVADRADGDGEALAVLGTPAGVAAVEAELVASGGSVCRSIDMPGVRVAAADQRRMICTPDGCAGSPPPRGTDVACRVTVSRASPMLIVDDAALVGAGGGTAVVVRTPALVAVCVRYFDLLWERAEPVADAAEPGAAPLSRSQQSILTMLLAGLPDETIARCLDISARSVRRQVAALEERAGAPSRFALGVWAVRNGWHPASAEDGHTAVARPAGGGW